jgi:hypothetical protein
MHYPDNNLCHYFSVNLRKNQSILSEPCKSVRRKKYVPSFHVKTINIIRNAIIIEGL